MLRGEQIMPAQNLCFFEVGAIFRCIRNASSAFTPVASGILPPDGSFIKCMLRHILQAETTIL